MKLSALDARIKLLLMALISTLALTVKSLSALAMLLALTIASLLIGGVEAGRVWRQTRMVLSLIVFIFLMQCMFNRSGAPLLTTGTFTLVTFGGVQAGLLVALRLLIVVASALLVLTGEARDYLLALHWLGLPWEICYMVLAALRFIPLLREEARTSYAAQQMRGCDLKSAPLLHKARLYVSLLIPVTAGALNRVDAMSIAMEARAFRSQPGRTSWRQLRIRSGDWLYGAIFILLLVGILWIFV